MKTILSSYRRYSYTVLLTIALVFCFTINGFATTWYISPSGNDVIGDGTIGNPWQTLYKATETVTTIGDIIHVQAGIYIETEQCFLSEGVSIEGVGITSILKNSLTDNFKAVLILSSAEGTNGNQHISDLKFDGQNLSTFWAVVVEGRSNVSIYNCSFADFKDRGIIFNGRSDLTDFPPDSAYATGNKFYNNIVNNCAAYSLSTGTYGRGCLNIGGQNGMLIYNNTITQNQRPEGQNGWPIKYISQGYLKNCKIYNNTLTKIPYGGSYPGENGWDFCIEFFNVEGLEISGNTIQGSIDLNYTRKGIYDYSVWIHHNTMSRATLNTKYESGIIFEFVAETAIIEYNILNNISSGVQFNTRDSTVISNCTIRKNLFSNLATADTVGTSGAILIISEGTNSAIISNLNIDNNTITATSVPGRQPWVAIDFSTLAHGFATNVNIRNNIVVGFVGAWLQGGDTTNMAQVAVMANDAYLNGNSNTPSWPGGNPATYNYDYFIGIDPLFDSTTNFHLQSISPVIDLGVPVGLTFLGVNPDLGYAEYGGGPPLAVKLIELSVRENNGRNILQWTTATENNSHYFTIERSKDATFYAPIGRVEARGFSATEVKYNFTDALPSEGKNYYRLAMIDKYGRLEYSKIVSIINKQNHSLGITYIDLSSQTNTASVNINSTKTQTANLSIIDISGRTVLNTLILLQKGDNTIRKNIPALAKGIYYVKLSTADETVVHNTLSRN